MSLADGTVATRLPTQDLERARRFYADKLGLAPVEERPGGLLYRCGGKEFALYSSTGAAPGTFTQMGWSVDDLDATMAELEARGQLPEQGRARRARGLVPRLRGQPPGHRPVALK